MDEPHDKGPRRAAPTASGALVGHRGLSHYYPENTEASVDGAIAAGLYGVEVDLRASRDGVPFLVHDVRLQRVAGLNARVDELCTEYDKCYDVNRRIEIIREIDGIVYNEYPYVLDHFGPAQRVAFWNKFSMPDFGALRFVDAEELMYTWWVDPKKEAALEAALADSSKTLERLPIENRFWQEWNSAQSGR